MGKGTHCIYRSRAQCRGSKQNTPISQSSPKRSICILQKLPEGQASNLASLYGLTQILSRDQESQQICPASSTSCPPQVASISFKDAYTHVFTLAFVTATQETRSKIAWGFYSCGESHRNIEDKETVLNQLPSRAQYRESRQKCPFLSLYLFAYLKAVA